MSKIFSHLSPEYVAARNLMATGRYNGAYYYSREIVENIIPRVKTDRNWVTIYIPGKCFDHSIFFVHRNYNYEANYNWVKNYNDVVLVCSTPATYYAMKEFGKPIYLPLSVDVDYVKKFKYKGKKMDRPCYVGNRWSFKQGDLAKYLPEDCDSFSNLPREDILQNMARYKEVYAVGRCAIEAKILGAEVKVCDSRYPDPDMWGVLDSKEASQILQKELDKIDEQN